MVIKNIFFCALLILCVHRTVAQHDHGTGDKPAVHGMLIFGQSTIYASHLPMFHSPHHYQVILELKLREKDKQLFLKDQQQHPEHTTYTIEPEKFVLPDKVNAKGSFKVNLYRGHFERGGVKIAGNIQVTIAKVVYFEQLNPAVPADTASRFIFFGNARQQFLAHRIGGKPDFDQVIQVFSDAPHIIEWPGGATYKMLTLPVQRNQPAGVSGNTVTAMLNDKPLPLVLQKQLYLEFDDLQ